MSVSSFAARLQLPGQTRLPINVVVDISDEQITLASGDHNLGEWPLEEVVGEVRSDGIYLKLGGEEIVLSLPDSDLFADALGIGGQIVTDPMGGNGEDGVLRSESNGSSKRMGLSSRLESISPEEQYDDLRRRISKLATTLADDSVSPPEWFGRWLRFLKEINLRHGQGAIPTTVFYRLNTELLELVPVPAREVPRPQPQPVAAGAPTARM